MSKYILLLALVSTTLATSEFVAALNQKPKPPQPANFLNQCLDDLRQAKASIADSIDALNRFNPHQAEAYVHQFLANLNQAGAHCSHITRLEIAKFVVANISNGVKLCLADVVVAVKGVPLIAEDIYHRDWENLVKDLRGQANLVEDAIQDCNKVAHLFN